MTRSTPRALRGVAITAAAALVLAACGNGADDGDAPDGGEDESTTDNEGDEPTTDDGHDDALGEGGEITVWAWDPTLESVASDFMELHENVTVDIVNVGTGDDQYTALQNAISAGSGGPDIAQVEFYALPQFVLGEALADLSQYGASDLDGTFTPGPWGAVTQDEGVYALPTDSGPMALFYNARIFDEHGLDVPETWEEYREVGRELQDADPNAHITNDTGDAGFTTSLIWQAGGHPFQVDGTDITVDLADEGSQVFSEFWETMVDEELVAPVSSWSDEWYQGLSDGSIATLVIGAWMRGNLESSVGEASGDWAVAPMPQWEAGASATAENGGSSLAIMEASQQQELAYAFLDYATVGDGVQTRIDEGAFPATVEHLEDEDFTTVEFDYFGGQRVNEVLADSAANVVEGWQYLPYQVYANSIFNDHVGQAYVSGTTIAEGLESWEQALVTYGNDQGFTVSAE
ncbi:ABC transporter substrate-binding protein [Bogoriella caseilytica]|uniref:Carbohydrate ABC transporter substrate-binding protein (CUT1 family) n=1 Tax=Bogoriella caseilytica TaxID=56055 RepID=A0A3N2BDZ4_9MICO|nr:sugar ABC transporter substrate-binding protein [Bogoriella caseilytica]ROR73483.1 carbohydrate ABC transporter substrate-binding protein (CUT1 family) [Bogoriella caseilytica]